jgi:hypothetical protein
MISRGTNSQRINFARQRRRHCTASSSFSFASSASVFSKQRQHHCEGVVQIGGRSFGEFLCSGS